MPLASALIDIFLNPEGLYVYRNDSLFKLYDPSWAICLPIYAFFYKHLMPLASALIDIFLNPEGLYVYRNDFIYNPEFFSRS
jgi:hypothetical protein